MLEGATLGGHIILRDLLSRLGPPIGGAISFFGGRGEATGQMWQSFRNGLDGFGQKHPQIHTDVLTGAERTFGAIHAWFAPFRASPGSLP